MLIEHWQWLISALHSCCEIWRKNERQVGSRCAGSAALVSFLFVMRLLSESTLSFFFFPAQMSKMWLWQTFLSFIYQCTQSSDRQPFICCKLWNPYDSPAHAIMPGHLIKVHFPSKIKCHLCIRSPCLCQRFLGLSDTKYLIMYNSPSFSVSGIYRFLFLKVCDKLTWFQSVS